MFGLVFGSLVFGNYHNPKVRVAGTSLSDQLKLTKYLPINLTLTYNLNP